MTQGQGSEVDDRFSKFKSLGADFNFDLGSAAESSPAASSAKVLAYGGILPVTAPASQHRRGAGTGTGIEAFPDIYSDDATSAYTTSMASGTGINRSHSANTFTSTSSASVSASEPTLTSCQSFGPHIALEFSEDSDAYSTSSGDGDGDGQGGAGAGAGAASGGNTPASRDSGGRRGPRSPRSPIEEDDDSFFAIRSPDDHATTFSEASC
jgi:hypothetical protein